MDGELPPVAARWDAVQSAIAKSVTLGNPGPAWKELAPDGAENENGMKIAGRTVELEFDPFNSNRIYAASAGGGVWLSTNSGADWNPIGDGLASLPVGAIGVSKKTPGLLLAGTGEAYYVEGAFYAGVGILRSTDDGATWSQTQLNNSDWPDASGSTGFHFIECGPDEVFLAGGNGGIYISSDAGVNWDVVNSIPPGGFGYDARWKPGDASTVYVTRGNSDDDPRDGHFPDGFDGVWKSTNINDAATFTQLSVGITMGIGKSRMDVVAAVPQSVYVVFSNPGMGLGSQPQGAGGDDCELWITTDDGASWSRPHLDTVRPGISQMNYNLSLAVNPTVQDTIFVGAHSGTVQRSTDGGVTWTPIGTSGAKDQHCLIYEPGSPTTLWLGCDSGVWRSLDGGSVSSWLDRNSGLSTLQFYRAGVSDGSSSIANPRWIAGGTQDNGLLQWRDRTSWWEPIATNNDGIECAFDDVGGQLAYCTARPFQYRTTDGGESWINFGLTAFSLPYESNIDVGPSNDAYLLRGGGLPAKRTPTAGSWTAIPVPNDATAAIAIAASPISADRVWWVTDSHQVLLTDDGGVSSTIVTDDLGTSLPGSPGVPTNIRAHPLDTQVVFATFSGYANQPHIARSTDSGTSWQDVTGDFNDNPHPVNSIAINPSNPDHWYIASDTGIWRTTNDGVNWVPFGDGLPAAYALDVEIEDDLQRVLAITHGRGVWEADIMEPGADVVWSGSVYVDKDYVVPVGAKLTIESGTDVSTVDGAQIVIEGELVAEGTGVSGTEIILGKVPAATTWGGLVIAASGQLTLDPLATGTVLDIRDASEGITFAPAATFDDISHIAFSGNTVDAVFEEEIVVASSTQESIASDLVIEIQDDVVIQSNGTLDIAQGVTIQANDVDTGDGDTIEITVEGMLSALGDASNRIQLTCLDTTPGSWDGVRFVETADARVSRIEYVEFEYPVVGVELDSLACAFLKPRFSGTEDADIYSQGDVVIQSGTSWDLDAPVKIEFKADGSTVDSPLGEPGTVDLVVHGSLLTDRGVGSSSSDFVTFTSDVQDAVNCDDWAGITVADGGVLNASFADIGFAARPVYLAYSDTGELRDCVLHDYSIEGLYSFFVDDVVVERCVFDRGSGLSSLIDTAGLTLYRSTGVVELNAIGPQTLNGLKFDNGGAYCFAPLAPNDNGGGLAVRDNTITGDDGTSGGAKAAIYGLNVCHARSAEVSGNTVTAWSGQSLELHTVSDMTVSCNRLYQNFRGMKYTNDPTQWVEADPEVVHFLRNDILEIERNALVVESSALLNFFGSGTSFGENTIELGSDDQLSKFLKLDFGYVGGPAFYADGVTWYDFEAGVDPAPSALLTLEGDVKPLCIWSPVQIDDLFITNLGSSDASCSAAQRTGLQDRVGPDGRVSEAAQNDSVSLLRWGMALRPNPIPRTSGGHVDLAVPVSANLQRVTVDIYDVSGRKVGNVVDRPLASGRHSFELKLLDRASAGVYFLRVRAGGYRQNAKIVLER